MDHLQIQHKQNQEQRFCWKAWIEFWQYNNGESIYLRSVFRHTLAAEHSASNYFVHSVATLFTCSSRFSSLRPRSFMAKLS